MTQKEIKERLNFHCEHGHNGFQHPQCFMRAMGNEEVIGIYDIEATNLSATFGFILAYCLKIVGKPIISRIVSPQEVRNGTTDKRLCETFVKDVEQITRLVGHYSCKFDLAYTRTRCLYWNIPFPRYGDLYQKDTWVICKNKLKLHSNRLEVACDFFGIESKHHKMKPEIWQQAMAGSQKALDYVLSHCKEDVVSTEKLWQKINPYILMSKTSI